MLHYIHTSLQCRLDLLQYSVCQDGVCESGTTPHLSTDRASGRIGGRGGCKLLSRWVVCSCVGLIVGVCVVLHLRWFVCLFVCLFDCDILPVRLLMRASLSCRISTSSYLMLIQAYINSLRAIRHVLSLRGSKYLKRYSDIYNMYPHTTCVAQPVYAMIAIACLQMHRVARNGNHWNPTIHNKINI